MPDNSVKEMSCPACGATMRFDPETGKMICDWCGTTAEIEKEESKEEATAEEAAKPAKDVIEGFDFESLNDQAVDASAEAVPIYHCKSCGAELIAPPEQISMTCPYCGSNVVLTQKVSGKLRPDGIIPFKIDPKSLPEHMTKYYKDKVLLPRKFFTGGKMDKVSGVYVPFWVFSGNISGELTFSGTTSTSSRSGDYIITETSVYDLERKVSMDFSDVPVDASGKVKDQMMDSIEPFDMSEVVGFDMRYLAGFTSDRFDEAKKSIANRAKKRMFSTAESAARSRILGYDDVKKTGGHLTASVNAKYILIPAYFFKIDFDGKEYEFAVNGQTGKVAGTLPIDKSICIRYYLVRALAALISIAAPFVALYLMGR
ncbi:MAG: hypothetical protein K6F73_01815 [Lachnospiraceae bacterium]|nr:hypothetical protein [Lachnospiraceae bacterium]